MDPITQFLQAFPQGLGLGAIVTLAIISIFKGWLVPKPFYDEMKARAESERVAKEKAMEAASSLLEQNTLLIKKEDVAHAAVQAIRDRAEMNRGRRSDIQDDLA